MNTNEAPVFIAVGLLLTALGAALVLSERFAWWGPSGGRLGYWFRKLGHDRTVWLSRVIFGPLLVCGGLALTFVALLQNR